MTDVDTRFDQLVDTIGEQDEAAIAAAAEQRLGSTEKVLDVVFAKFLTLFDPERAGDVTGIFQYAVTTRDGVRHRAVHVGQGRAWLEGGQVAEPTVTLGLSLTDLLLMATGRLSGQDAFMTGKLEVDGDMFFSMNWAQWFPAPQ